MTNSSATGNIGVADLFHMLESNKLSDVEEIKKVFHDHFLSTKDNWLVNGLFDYYLSTDSQRAVEVLAGVREPHDKHLFDKLNEALAAKPSNNGQKVRTLTLLGHVARRQPTWLYKLASHSLFKQLIHLLKVEDDIVLVMSALLLLITLLPMLPTSLTPHLNEIFEVFSRLSSFYYHRLSTSSVNQASFTTMSSLNFSSCDPDQLYLLHLQVGLHNLFHRLYAMYPCNFVSFLKHQYLRDQLTIFKKVISPMLDSVRMHPLLITMSKETEISASRWKKMEHHDVIAECGRFSLLEKSNRDDIISLASMRFTPISVLSDQSCPYTPVSNSDFPMVVEQQGVDDIANQDSFWSPSMIVSGQSPPPPSSLQATPLSTHDPKSTPSTPGTGVMLNSRNRTSPPEAAVEATPETTPVKDTRQGPMRQVPVNSAAVRALSAFGNNGLLNSSRPSTPTSAVNRAITSPLSSSTSVSVLLSGTGESTGPSSILDRKIGKIVADRQNAVRQDVSLHQRHEDDGRKSAPTLALNDQLNALVNGKNESWQQSTQLEDQEVSDIVSSRKLTFGSDKSRQTLNDLTRKVRLKFVCKYPTPVPTSFQQCSHSKSCPDISKTSSENHSSIGIGTFRPLKDSSADTEDSSTQTCGLVPYENFLYDIIDQKIESSVMTQQQNEKNIDTSRLSPSAMLERYIEVCARANFSDNKLKSKTSWSISKQINDTENGSQYNDEHSNDSGNCWSEMEYTHQQIQLMQMQLQFERQRREVHAERNRRLLGKLRDSRALEELNSAMTNRLKVAENETESLRNELNASRIDARTAEQKLLETTNHWQNKYKEEQQKNGVLNDRINRLEDELKSEKNKVTEHEKQRKAAESTLFEAAHQLKEALRAANQSEELKRVLDTVQKRFLLLGEAQARIQEKMVQPVHMARQEAAQIQRSWSEEVSNLRRQLESQTLHLESLKSRLSEYEHKDARKEVQLVDQQRLFQEAKEKHSAELEAVESKYKAQFEVNLLLEGRILELLGKLEQAPYGTSSVVNLASSASPKERSPPLSASLASSSEGSLAFIHSVLNDCCDPAGEISNLQAIVEPGAEENQQ